MGAGYSMLKINKIQKSYKSHEILRDITFEAKKGECIGIIGANGCGKSTLLSIIAGAVRADGGSISFTDGTPYTPDTCSALIGYVPQENPLFDRLTAIDNLHFWYGSNQKQLKSDLNDGLPALFGITGYLNKRVENMSGGMKKRLGIACSLAGHQPVLILDEPCAALDLPCKEDIRSWLKTYISDGNTVIITSHEEAEIAMCDTVWLLKDGRLNEFNKNCGISSLIEAMR